MAQRQVFQASQQSKPVTGIVQTYNAASGLEETLKSIRQDVDRILVMDGYFTTQSYHARALGEKRYSTDNSQNVARKYGAEWVPADREYKRQWDKLNRIPELVKEDEWIFIIDTDEVLVSYVENGLRTVAGWFDAHCDMMMMKIEEPYYQHPLVGIYGRHRYYARLMKVKKGMRWTDEANMVYPGRVSLYAGTVPNTVFIRHLRKDV